MLSIALRVQRRYNRIGKRKLYSNDVLQDAVNNADQEKHTPKKIKVLRRDNGGDLPAYVWPGGYPIFYLDSGNNVLCVKCANKVQMGTYVIEYDVNYEDPDLYCDDCSEQIESAYGDDNDSDSDNGQEGINEDV